VSRSDDLSDIIAEIGAPNVKLLFDIYHVQIMEGT
jgi:hydroxypyruvate isomerase